MGGASYCNGTETDEDAAVATKPDISGAMAFAISGEERLTEAKKWLNISMLSLRVAAVLSLPIETVILWIVSASLWLSRIPERSGAISMSA